MCWESIGERLSATLQLLEFLAERGAKFHAGRIKHGGSEREEARKRLFYLLAGEYKGLFGTLPTGGSPTVSPAVEGEPRETLPGGPAIRWFSALLGLVGERARAAVQPREPATHMPQIADCNALLAELVALVSAAKGKSGKSDALAHWIREGSADWARPREKQQPEFHDPDFDQPSLDEPFG